MDKTIKLLGGLLAAQLLIALAVFSSGSDLSAQRPDEPLITFDPATVNRIEIAGTDGASVSLSKSEQGGWVLSDAWNAPAKPDKVAQFLRRLSGLKKGLAVATTAGAQTRFEVAEDTFQRRIALIKGEETIGTIYLGTSPGLRKIHARTDGEDPIYSLAFSAYETPAKPDGWLDSELLQVGDSKLDAVELGGLSLTRAKTGKTDGDGTDKPAWSADGLAEGERLDAQKAQDLLDKIASLTVRKVLDIKVKPEYRQDQPELVMSLRSTGAEPVTWTWSKLENGEDYVLKSSDRPWYFEVASWAGKPLLEAAAREALIISSASPVEVSEDAAESDAQDESTVDATTQDTQTSG